MADCAVNHVYGPPLAKIGTILVCPRCKGRVRITGRWKMPKPDGTFAVVHHIEHEAPEPAS